MAKGREKPIGINGKVAQLADDSELHLFTYSQCECGKTLDGLHVELVRPDDIGREDSHVVEVMCLECFARAIIPQPQHA